MKAFAEGWKRRISQPRKTRFYLLSLLLLWTATFATIVVGFVAPSTTFQEHFRIQNCPLQTSSCKTSTRTQLPQLCAITKRISLEDQRWFPLAYLDDKGEEDWEALQRDLEQASVDLLANIIRPLIFRHSADDEETRQDTDVLDQHDETRQAPKRHVNTDDNDNGAAVKLAKGRFLDLCCSLEGEQRLESLFEDDLAREAASKDIRIIQGAVVCLQRLLVLGMTYGVTMNMEVLTRSVNHMREDADEVEALRDPFEWTASSSRRLKYQATGDDSVKIPGIQLLAAVSRRQSPIGAYELLVDMCVWEKHENLALLRSGVPLRFTEAEDQVARDAANSTRDPDEVLGIRRDLREQKVFTIDSASTSEIDDGLGVEVIEDSNQSSRSPRYRYWIHIADADRWAPRDSELLEIARRRATSIYLPNEAISMMPAVISSDVMSLRANTDSEALSLGVELAEDGSIVDSSTIVCPSRVRVTYRLTYDQVNEMIEDGIAFNEEWELGHLLTAAQTRREFRLRNGSAEKFIPNPIPQYSLSVFPDQKAPDGQGIKVNIQVSHNSGKNLSSVEENTKDIPRNMTLAEELPASASSTLVTEMMILAGEALGKWARRQTTDLSKDDEEVEEQQNPIKLPFRSQPKPDYRSRSREKKIMMDLLEYNIGDGYCHAWYARRFLSPVKVSPFYKPHSGLGLECYVQWTSPIRRFQDLQVHAVVKRFLRRQKIVQMARDGQPIPDLITSQDLGCNLVESDRSVRLDLKEADSDIEYDDRTKLIGPITHVMRNSQKYWIMEYIHRLKAVDPGLELNALVLGCVNPTKRQYAVYLYELGLEWRYSSPVSLQAGMRFKVRIGNIAPLNGQLALVRVHA
jgi:exoribonuclease R